MRLAIVTETYPPEVNGVAMTLQQLAEGMVQRGHSVEIIRPRQNAEDHHRTADGIEHVTVPGVPLPRYDGLKLGLPSAGVMIRRWRANPPNVAHIATEGPLGLSALWATHRVKLPVTSAFHTNFHEYFDHYGLSPLRRFLVWYLKRFHNACCSTMVPAIPMRDALAARGFERLTLLGRGVDTDLFNPGHRSDELRGSWGASPDDVVMIYVGRVAEEKNMPLAIEAYHRARQRVPKLKLVVVGDGPLRDQLQKAHPDVIFAGTRRGQELGAHYASADIFVFASTTETYGNVIPEAMASGIAVVTFDYAAGQALIQDNENGRLARFGDDEHFIQVVAELSSDPAAIDRCRSRARTTTLALSWTAVHERFEQLLIDASKLQCPEAAPADEARKAGTQV